MSRNGGLGSFVRTVIDSSLAMEAGERCEKVAEAIAVAVAAELPGLVVIY